MSQQKVKDTTAVKVRIGGHHHAPTPVLKKHRRTRGNLRPQRFVSLHHHSTFSYLDGYQLPEAHVRRVSELNMSAMCLTEHGNIDSHTRFEQDALKAGVEPLFGCEIYMNTGKEPTQRKYHLTLIAKDAIGYANLIELVTLSWKNHYYEPTVLWRDLVKHRAGLFVLSGCQGSLLFCSTVGGKGIRPDEASYRRGLEVARHFKRAFGRDYLIEVQAFPELDRTREFAPLAGRLARAIGTRLVATMDCHYTALEESEIQQILHNLRPGEKRTLEEQAREWGYDAPLCPPPNDRSIYRRLRATGLSKQEAVQAIVTTEEIAQECMVELPRLPMVRFPLPDGYTSAVDYWRDQLRAGWRYRGFHKLSADERERAKVQLKIEMDLIESKNFVDYFLLTQAGVVHVKDQGIPVGPARGSAAASVAAFLLRITEINPLRFPLLRFERFIDASRQDLPDIDLDFPGTARPILRRFYERMLGPGCVNNVGTFTFFRNKNSLDDVARVYKIPSWEINTVKDLLIERASGDLRASSTVEDTVAQFPAAAEVFERHPELYNAAKLEGNVKGFGVHAAGLILSNDSITNVTSVAEREVPKGSGNFLQVIGLDKHDAARRGLLKMDFLSLSTMSMIEDMLLHPSVDMSLEDLYSLPFDDQDVYAAFQRNDVVGVFQFDGRATRFVCGQLKPEKFGDLMDCNSLSRPGPLHSETTGNYLDIRKGRKKPELLHPALDSITEPTQYEIVYQEQILSILRVVGNFPWTTVAEVRKIISQKHGEQAFNRKRQQFLDGAAKLHERLPEMPPMSMAVAERIWKRMITAGTYAFNAAHCASYGLIGYWTMWFKVHHPAVFYAASLTHTSDSTMANAMKQRELLRDADRHVIEILPPDVKLSMTNWKAGKKKIRAGFEQVPGIGDKTAQSIIEARTPRWTSWKDLLVVKGIGPKTVAKFTEWSAKDDPFDMFKIDREIAELKRLIKAGRIRLPYPTHTGEMIEDTTDRVVWVGQILSKDIRDLFEYTLSRTGEALDPARVKDPELREWAVMQGDDLTERVVLRVDRWRYPRFKRAVMGAKIGHDLVLVQGRRNPYAGNRSIKVETLWVIDPE